MADTAICSGVQGTVAEWRWERASLRGHTSSGTRWASTKRFAQAWHEGFPFFKAAARAPLNFLTGIVLMKPMTLDDIYRCRVTLEGTCICLLFVFKVLWILYYTCIFVLFIHVLASAEPVIHFSSLSNLPPVWRSLLGSLFTQFRRKRIPSWSPFPPFLDGRAPDSHCVLSHISLCHEKTNSTRRIYRFLAVPSGFVSFCLSCLPGVRWSYLNCFQKREGLTTSKTNCFPLEQSWGFSWDKPNLCAIRPGRGLHQDEDGVECNCRNRVTWMKSSESQRRTVSRSVQLLNLKQSGALIIRNTGSFALPLAHGVTVNLHWASAAGSKRSIGGCRLLSKSTLATSKHMGISVTAWTQFAAGEELLFFLELQYKYWIFEKSSTIIHIKK